MRGRKRERVPRPGLETTEITAQQRAELDAPPPQDAFSAGSYPAVLSGGTSVIVGAIMLVVGVLVVVDATRLPTTSDPMGPAAFPYAIGSLLALVGLALVLVYRRYALVLLRVRRSGIRRGRGVSTLLTLVAIVGFAALLPLAGFFVAAALLYIAVAILLGAPRGWHLVITGVILAGAVVLLFDRIIGLSLPAGPWGF